MYQMIQIGGRIREPMVHPVLSRSFLFNDISAEELKKIMSRTPVNTQEYYKGEVICAPDTFDHRLGFIIDGECEVIRKNESGADVRMRSLKLGDSFGIISVFSNSEEYPTTIIAAKKCSVIYINRSDIYDLIDNYPKIARNVIEFFADRISFLNARVATFAASSVEQKLARCILGAYRDSKSGTIRINKVKTAMELGVGRASLYRAISHFESEKLLKIENKTIQILNPEGLERISK